VNWIYITLDSVQWRWTKFL